jgi:hypothetical protein
LAVPDGLIAALTRECEGNVHERGVVHITSGSFETETHGANPHSGVYNDDPVYAAKNVADFGNETYFHSAYREQREHIRQTKNNWICYDFKHRRIVPTYYSIRSSRFGPHLKSWLVETSPDGEGWREIAHEENNEQLKGGLFIATFEVVTHWECRFIRLVNIGRNHSGSDHMCISAWEIFGRFVD